MLRVVCRPSDLGWEMADARKLFGRNLAQLADRDGYSRSGLAAHLGVHPTMVSRWIQGNILPTKYLDGIAAYFDVQVAKLFIGEDEPVPPPKERAPVSLDDAFKVVAETLGYSVRRKHN